MSYPRPKLEKARQRAEVLAALTVIMLIGTFVSFLGAIWLPPHFELFLTGSLLGITTGVLGSLHAALSNEIKRFEAGESGETR